jgi:hypothetical protein
MIGGQPMIGFIHAMSLLWAEFLQRAPGGFAFGGFFGLPTAPGQLCAVVADGAFKMAVMIGAAGGNKLVLGGGVRT